MSSEPQLRERLVDVVRAADSGIEDISVVRQVAVFSGLRPARRVPITVKCSELWLLLHFADHRAHITDYRAARDLLVGHVPGCDKKLDRTAFGPGVEDAVARAALLGPGNPATHVGRLVQAVLRT